MIHLTIAPIFIQIGIMTTILLIFAYILLKYLTYTTPNPDAKIGLSDKDPNHKLKGYKRQDLSIHELRKYDGRHAETNFVIFVAVNGYIFDVTIDRHLYGPGGHYFALAGRDASRALSKFTISCESIPTEEDLMSDLTSSEVGQLNEWYAQFSERYQCVGRLIRSNQERYIYDHSDEEILDDSDDNFDDELDKYCGIQSEVLNITMNTFINNNHKKNDTCTIIADNDCHSDSSPNNGNNNSSSINSIKRRARLLTSINKPHLSSISATNIKSVDSDEGTLSSSSSSSSSSCKDKNVDSICYKLGTEQNKTPNHSSSSLCSNNDMIKQ